jgi:tetratricopeptide (TPR) repeat protein
MAKTWMAAAEENGIPTAFIIRDGKIAWIGHPMSMDEPLAKVTAGQWDAAAMAKTRLAEKAKERKMMAVQSKVYTPYRSKDYRATLSAIDEVTSSDPELAQNFAIIKLNCLCQLGDNDEALKLGHQLLEKYRDEAMSLNNIFFQVVDLDLKKQPDPRMAKLALEAARRADELTKGNNYLILDTLAVALYRAGEFAEAAATEEKALKVLDEQVADKSQPMYKSYSKSFKEQIEKFRKAAAEKGAKTEKP